MKPVTLLIKEVPEGSVILVKDTYIKLPANKAFTLVEQGYAVGYDVESKKEVYPFLSEDYPHRNILFKRGIYTEEQLRTRLGYVATLNGIGEKSIEKYKELLSNFDSKESEEEVVSTDDKSIEAGEKQSQTGVDANDNG